MLITVLICALVTVTVAEVPSYIHVCGRKDPDLDGCVIRTIEAMREKLRVGLPDLGVSPMEPYSIPEFNVADEKDFRVAARNVKIRNFMDFILKNLHINLEDQSIEVDFEYDNFRLTADGDISARILVPISAHGFVDLDIVGMRTLIKTKYQLVNHKGSKYMFFPSSTAKMTIKDYTCHFSQGDGKDNTLTDAVNSLLRDNRQPIIQLFIPEMEKAMSTIILELSNTIMKHINYDEAFSDRE